MNVAERKWKFIKLVRERFASFRISDRPIPVGAVEVMISCCGVLDVAALAGVGWRCSDLQRPPVVWLRGRSPSDNSELAGAQVSSYLQYLDCFGCRNSGHETLSWGRKRITRSIRFSKSTLHF